MAQDPDIPARLATRAAYRSALLYGGSAKAVLLAMCRHAAGHVETEMPYYVEGDPNGYELCRQCAVWLARHFRRHWEPNDYAYPYAVIENLSPEIEGSPCCDVCGVPLEMTQIGRGPLEEIEQHLRRPTKAMSVMDAWHLWQALTDMEYMEEDDVAMASALLPRLAIRCFAQHPAWRPSIEELARACIDVARGSFAMGASA